MLDTTGFFSPYRTWSRFLISYMAWIGVHIFKTKLCGRRNTQKLPDRNSKISHGCQRGLETLMNKLQII